jgi:hypothetical protein
VRKTASSTTSTSNGPKVVKLVVVEVAFDPLDLSRGVYPFRNAIVSANITDEDVSAILESYRS